MHKHRSALFCRGLLLLAAAAGTLKAQETNFSTDLKLRAGYSLATKDHLRPGVLGFGLNFGYTTSIGTLGAELGYYYQTGDQYVVPFTNSDPVAAGKQPLDASHSGDERRNQLDGFAIRLSLARPISESWDWHAGLMLGGTRFKHQYVGDVRGQNWDANHTDSWRDTYSGTPQNGGVKVSPYGGVTWKIDADSAFEFNVLLVNYQAMDHVHVNGSADHGYPVADGAGPLSVHNDFSGDRDTKTNRIAPQFEVTYVFHF